MDDDRQDGFHLDQFVVTAQDLEFSNVPRSTAEIEAQERKLMGQRERVLFFKTLCLQFERTRLAGRYTAAQEVTARLVRSFTELYDAASACAAETLRDFGGNEGHWAACDLRNRMELLEVDMWEVNMFARAEENEMDPRALIEAFESRSFSFFVR